MLGSKTKRYRQCVLTTYVFDPVAFEICFCPNWGERTFGKAGEDADEWFYRPLHAKLIHLQFPDREILLMGSANCSAAALGEGDAPSTNAEASLLVERLDQGDYLKDL